MLKISIVTVCYNMAAYIEQTILSVLSQDYDNLEYIIIDGGSTDGTLKIIDRYKDRLAHFVSEPDKGMYDALNKGFALATGDVFAWINADDIYMPGALKSVNKVFSKYNDIQWICGRSAYLSEDGSLRFVTSKVSIKTREDIRNGWCREDALGFLMQEGMFWRKSLMQKCGFLNTKYKYAGDFELWKRFATEAEICFVNIPLSAFRKRENNLASTKLNDYLSEIQEIISQNRKYPSLIWRLIPSGWSNTRNIMRMLRMRRGNVVYFSYADGSPKMKRIVGSASAHTFSSLTTLI